MTKPIIQIENISKKYLIGTRRSGDIRQSFRNLTTFQGKDKKEIWALKDINLEVSEGEILGIIGPNGSGKSTLLKILSKITNPTKGKAILRGRVSTLLEIGTGFHPELTGIDNIYLNGSILGMKRTEIKSKFDEIVDFSGIEDFIHTPIKHYSSGMQVRLAFSIAAHLNTDILLIDEVLSVGDQSFRKKSLNKISEISNFGKTALFVSHNLAVVKSLCTKGMLLINGQNSYFGAIEGAIDKYINEDYSTNKIEFESDILKLSSFSLYNNQSKAIGTCQVGDSILIAFDIHFFAPKNNLKIRMDFKNNFGMTLFTCNTRHTNFQIKNINGKNRFVCKIKKLALNIGSYYISLYIKSNGELIFEKERIFNFNIIEGDFYGTSLLPFKDKLFLVEHNWSLQ